MMTIGYRQTVLCIYIHIMAQLQLEPENMKVLQRVAIILAALVPTLSLYFPLELEGTPKDEKNLHFSPLSIRSVMLSSSIFSHISIT
jgi:hypothetical protein